MTWTYRYSEKVYALNGIAYGNNQFVAVGDSGTILTSPDGITWTSHTSGTGYDLNGIAYGNNQFVAVGSESSGEGVSGTGTILTSSDGITWTNRTSGTPYRLYGIAYGNNEFVAVSGDVLVEGTTLTSPDGIIWTTRTSGTVSAGVRGIAYGDNQFAAVGNYGTILTSPDGINWTTRASGNNPYWPPYLGIAYGNNQFVAVGGFGMILESGAVGAKAGVANLRANQRPSTTLVDLYYDLSGAGSVNSVSVAVFSDGGATFAVPATHFSGDGVTSPAAPGASRHIVWDAGADLGAVFFPNVVLGVSAGGSAAASGIFTVNLRGLAGGLAMSGTVLDEATGKVLAGANVQLGTASAQTDVQGHFQFASVAVGDYALTTSLAGYVTANDSVSVAPGSSPARVIALQRLAAPGSAPHVTSVKSKYPSASCYLDSVPFSVLFTATVDWAGHPPGKVQFLTPRRAVEVTTSGPTASQTLDMGVDFGPNGRLRVVAVSGDGTRSGETVANLVVAPSPFPISLAPLWGVEDQGSSFSYNTSIDTTIFAQGVEEGMIPKSIPVFGSQALKVQFIPAIECAVKSDGTATLAMKWDSLEVGQLLEAERKNHGLRSLMDLMHGLVDNGQIDPGVLPHTWFGGLDLTLFPELGGGWKYRVDAGEWQPNGAFAGLGADLSVSQTWPFVVGFVPLYAKVQATLSEEATVSLLQLSPLKLAGQLDVNPSLRGSLGVGLSDLLAAEGWVEGGAKIDMQWPQPPNSQPASLYVKAGATVYYLIGHKDYSGLFWSWPTDGVPLRQYRWMSRQAAPWQPLGRDYLQHSSHGIFAPSFKSRKKGDAGGGRVNILLSPVFPYSDANCSSSGTNVCLAFLTDNTNRASMNRTIAMFTKFDGTNWSLPVAIADDGTADFHPHVLSFPDGSAVAAWENEGALLPDSATLDMMKSNLEVSVAWFNPTTDSWLPAWQVTTNSFLDRSPRLAGRSKDNVLLTWVANAANDENGGPASPNQLWSAHWNGSAWSNPQLATTVSNALVKYGLVYDGTTANLVLSVDTVSGSTNVDGHELFRVVHQNGAWGPLTQLTSDQVPDDNPQLTLDPQGNVVLTWLRGAELSSVVNFAMTNRQVLRTNEYSSNLADFTLAASGGGKRALLWAEPSENSSDLFGMFYDPAARVWGAPKQLTHDPQTERGTTAAFVGEGELVTVYDRTLLSSTNAPAASLADLVALVYPLGEDLALDGSSIYSDPPNPNPGGTATLHVRALNLGDQVETNMVVAFYRDAVQTASELGRVTVTNAIPPQGTNDVTFTWSVPATNSSMTVFAVIDPDQRVPDVSRSNNIVRLDLVKPDAGIQSMS